MKELVLYYSFSGTTKRYAEELARERDADICQIEEAAERTAAGAWFRGIFQARRGAAVEIKTPALDFGLYGAFVLAAPVWAGAPAPAINRAAELLPQGTAAEIILVSGSGRANAAKLAARLKARGCEIRGITHVKSREIKEPKTSAQAAMPNNNFSGRKGSRN